MNELLKHIRNRAVFALINLDKHDPDFIVGVIIEWLGQNNKILTPTGLRSKEELEYMEDQLQFYQANYAGDPDSTVRETSFVP